MVVDSGFAKGDSVECVGSDDAELGDSDGKGSIAEDVDEDCSVCDFTDDCVVEVTTVGWRDDVVSNEIKEDDTDVESSNADVVSSDVLEVTSDDSVVVSDEPKVTSDELVVTTKASVETSDELVVTSDDSVLTTDELVVASNGSVVTSNTPLTVVATISSIVVVTGVVSTDVIEVIEDKVVCVVSIVDTELLDEGSPAVVDIAGVVGSRELVSSVTAAFVAVVVSFVRLRACRAPSKSPELDVVAGGELVSSVTAAVVAVVVSFVRLKACRAPPKSPELDVVAGGELVTAKSFENSASSQLVGFKPRLRISTTEDMLPKPLKKYCKKLKPIKKYLKQIPILIIYYILSVNPLPASFHWKSICPWIHVRFRTT